MKKGFQTFSPVVRLSRASAHVRSEHAHSERARR